jgi:hypothetical protein
MKTYISFVLLALMCPAMTMAQPKYQINGVKVVQYGDTLRNAWVGGFNNPVFSPIDLNQDGLMDLFIYDKAGWKALSFLNTGSVGHPSFTYAPEYDRIYPATLRDWAVIRDYDHDGVGDIFALNDASGIAAYKGYRNGNSLAYRLTYPQLLYPWGSVGETRIFTFADNMPVIMDIDGDGALDVLAPDDNTVTLDYFRNIAVDSGYSSDSLSFILQTTCWGNFMEDYNDCNVMLNQMCKKELSANPPTYRDLRDAGGSCYGIHYHPQSKVTSIFVSDRYCNSMKLLFNTGDSSYARISAVDEQFPVYDVSINLPLFPGVFGADIDNDGYEDLMVAPFATNVDYVSQSEDVNVIRYYHNDGIDTVNKYHYEGDTLLNNSLVDVGTESHAVFFDYNNDGLMDIVIGRYGRFVAAGQPASGIAGTSISSLYLYENVGSDTMPVYQLVDTDWNRLSVYDANGLYNGLYPAFGDLDGDGLPDMVVGNFSGNIAFFHNSGTASLASYPAMTQPNWFDINVQNDAAPFIYDVNGDGLNDLVIGSSGRSSGDSATLHYYWNFGTATVPKFSKDSVNSFFGGIAVWDQEYSVLVEGFANPFIQRENGTLVLYAGSQRGIIFKYLIDQDKLRGGAFTLLDSNVLGVNPGLRSNVSIADINHDGKNDYLIGNVRGGIMLFSDTAWSSSSTTGIATIAAQKDELQIFPNPAKDKVVCRLTNDAALVTAVLYDLLGEAVSAPVSRASDNSLTISVGNLANGIYVVQAKDRSGNIYQRKISIFK